MGVVQNIIGIARGINDRKRKARVEDVYQQNYLSNPEAMLSSLMEVSAPDALAYEQEQNARNATARATAEAERKARAERLTGAAEIFRTLPENSDFGAMLPQLSPFLKRQGLDDEDIGALTSLAASGVDLRLLDDKAAEAILDDRYTTKVGTPGSHFVRGGEKVHEVPFAKRTVTTRAGNTASTDVFDPNTGEFVIGEEGEELSEGGGSEFEEAFADITPSVDMSVEAMRPHFIAQESNGDYTAVNSETGALGAYQVMPETGRALAARLKMPWRPDMMKKDDRASRNYQDAIGGAAIQEAIEASGGDPGVMAMYYHGGSNRSGWGPRTRQYREDMLGRIGGGGGALPGVNANQTTRTRHGVSVVDQKPGKRVRVAAKEELPPGATYAQVDETGKLINIRYAPAAKPAKAGESQETKLEAKRQVSTTLGAVGQAYVKLAEEGGIVDPENSALQNIGARIGSSAVGQLVGGAVGTDAQSIRARINNSRPLLINQIRQATGMSAKSMDSNAELQFYLQAATDPTKDLPSNLAAIMVLDDLYGDGTALDDLPPQLLQRVREQTALLRKDAPRSGGTPEGTVIRNKKTGERRIFRGGKWEKMQ